MKKAIITALLALALPLVTQAQKQTFNLPAFFATNVYLYDNTNLPLHLRISGSAVSNVQDWATLAAVTNINVNQFDLDNVGGIDFDTTPTGTIAAARMQWNPDFQTVRLGLDAAVSLDVGQQHVAFVRNAESVTISNGTVVYISGASGDKAEVKIASYSNDTLSARTIGIAAENITAGNTGFVVTRGPVYAQKTDTFTAGAMLYLGAYGNVTTNRPSAPLHGVFVGVVEKVNANAGVIYVAVQNGFEMDELHDVNVASVTSGQVLQYNGTVWTNSGNILSLNGGTLTNSLTISRSTTAATMLTLTNSGSIPIGLRADLGSGGTYLDFNQTGTGAGDEYTFSDTIANFHGNKITNALIGSENLTNLSVIAGSGLGVTNNQLVVTNVAGGDASGWSGFAATQNVNMAGNSITNTKFLQLGFESGTPAIGNVLYYANPVGESNALYYYKGFSTPNKVWHSGNVTPLTASSAQSTFWRITTAPTSSTAYGERGQLAVSQTNLYIFIGTNTTSGIANWLRIQGTTNW